MLTVVGQAVIPLIDNAEPGEGAIPTTDGLRAHRGPGGGRYLLLMYADDADRSQLEQRLTDDYGAVFTRYSDPEPPGKLLQLGGMTGLLGALGAFLACLGVVGLLHFLAVSVRRRRREFAVLRSLGFARRDVGLTVSSQAVTIAAFGVLAGVPLGVVVGRWAWADGRRVGGHDRHAGRLGGPAGGRRRRRDRRRRGHRCRPRVAGHPPAAGRRIACRVMTPVAVIAGAQVRRGWWLLAVLAVFVAVASGLAMAGIAVLADGLGARPRR